MQTMDNFISIVRELKRSTRLFKVLVLIYLFTIFSLGLWIGIVLNIWYVK